MPGDELHEEAGSSAQSALDAGRGRSGPRHAAPRKPLLTRLHVPAGKAIAIAAMPSAVLMGMGLTPQLASAKPLPKNPFKGGACVSQPDKDAAEDAKKEKAAKEKAEREKAEKEKEEGSAGDGSESSEPGSGGSDKPEPSPSEPPSSGGGGGGGSEKPDPSPSPSDPEEDEEEGEDEDDGGLLGGIGDAIGDILSPKEKAAKEKEEEKKEEAEASPSASPSDSGPSKSKPIEDTVGKVGDGLKDTTDKLGKTAEDTAEGAKGGLAGEKAGSKERVDGKKGFPCVEEKKVAGDDEQTPATLPNESWKLEASSLGLHGLDYKGVVNIRTADGKTKQALKFTANSLDIGDLHQIVEGPDGTKYHVQAAKGSTSTIRGGKVTMYTEELKGNLFGLIPITFDPEHPPPLNIPEAYFTNVEVKQAGQFGGNLTVPGLRQSID